MASLQGDGLQHNPRSAWVQPPMAFPARGNWGESTYKGPSNVMNGKPASWHQADKPLTPKWRNELPMEPNHSTPASSYNDNPGLNSNWGNGPQQPNGRWGTSTVHGIPPSSGNWSSKAPQQEPPFNNDPVANRRPTEMSSKPENWNTNVNMDGRSPANAHWNEWEDYRQGHGSAVHRTEPPGLRAPWVDPTPSNVQNLNLPPKSSAWQDNGQAAFPSGMATNPPTTRWVAKQAEQLSRAPESYNNTPPPRAYMNVQAYDLSYNIPQDNRYRNASYEGASAAKDVSLRSEYWYCDHVPCRFKNPGWSLTCSQCGFARKPADTSNDDVEWKCTNCRLINLGSNLNCFQCGNSRNDAELVINPTVVAARRKGSNPTFSGMKPAPPQSMKLGMSPAANPSARDTTMSRGIPVSGPGWFCSLCKCSNSPMQSFCCQCGSATPPPVSNESGSNYPSRQINHVSEESYNSYKNSVNWKCRICGTWMNETEMQCSSCNDWRQNSFNLPTSVPPGFGHSTVARSSQNIPAMQQEPQGRGYYRPMPPPVPNHDWQCYDCRGWNLKQQQFCGCCGNARRQVARSADSGPPMAHNLPPEPRKSSAVASIHSGLSVKIIEKHVGEASRPQVEQTVVNEDWPCPLCEKINIATEILCRHCNELRGWGCAKCKHINRDYLSACIKCRHERNKPVEAEHASLGRSIKDPSSPSNGSASEFVAEVTVCGEVMSSVDAGLEKVTMNLKTNSLDGISSGPQQKTMISYSNALKSGSKNKNSTGSNAKLEVSPFVSSDSGFLDDDFGAVGGASSSGHKLPAQGPEKQCEEVVSKFTSLSVNPGKSDERAPKSYQQEESRHAPDNIIDLSTGLVCSEAIVAPHTKENGDQKAAVSGVLSKETLSEPSLDTKRGQLVQKTVRNGEFQEMQEMNDNGFKLLTPWSGDNSLATKPDQKFVFSDGSTIQDPLEPTTTTLNDSISEEPPFDALGPGVIGSRRLSTKSNETEPMRASAQSTNIGTIGSNECLATFQADMPSYDHTSFLFPSSATTAQLPPGFHKDSMWDFKAWTSSSQPSETALGRSRRSFAIDDPLSESYSAGDSNMIPWMRSGRSSTPSTAALSVPVSPTRLSHAQETPRFGSSLHQMKTDRGFNQALPSDADELLASVFAAAVSDGLDQSIH